jgi:hypothetical protein
MERFIRNLKEIGYPPSVCSQIWLSEYLGEREREERNLTILVVSLPAIPPHI